MKKRRMVAGKIIINSENEAVESFSARVNYGKTDGF